MKIKELTADVIVVGTGAAGCAAARKAADDGAQVLLLSKDPMTASDTKIAEGIVTVVASGEGDDDAARLAKNMRIQGDDLGEPDIAAAFGQDSGAAYDWLVGEGLLSGLSASDGKPEALPLPLGGHDRKRSVDHKNGALDYTHALWSSVQRTEATLSPITIIEDIWAIDLLVDREGDTPILYGLLAFHAATGDYIAVKSPSVILACGGGSTLYFPCTDTMRGNMGDAYGMALRAGVELIDMEQVQFLPFGITKPRAFEGILAGEPVSCGPFGVLRDANGDIILSELMLKTRAECAAAIARAVADGRGTENNGCWLDLTGNIAGAAGPLFQALMQKRMGSILANIRKAMGPKAARFEEWWEVRPTAHYFMGGIKTDAQCRTSLPGLHAAGQAMGGLHGSNRLGSTSLAEGAIFGRRAGEAAASFHGPHLGGEKFRMLAAAALKSIDAGEANPESTHVGGEAPSIIQRALQKAAFKSIGPARTYAELKAFLDDLDTLSARHQQANKGGPTLWRQALLDWLDTRNLLATAYAITHSAIARPQSLGAHIRTDRVPGQAARHQSISVQQVAPAGYRVSVMNRPTTPFHQKLPFKVAEAVRTVRLKLVRKLPQSSKDRILTKMYTGMLAEPDPTETKS